MICGKGHELSEENTYKDGRCKTCRREYDNRSAVKSRKNILSRERYKQQEGRRIEQRRACAQWYAANKDHKLEYGKRQFSKTKHSRHKLSNAEFDSILRKQNNLCAVCEESFSDANVPHVDHDHLCCQGLYSCGECVRGLLCGKCNRGIGLLKDDPRVLGRALRYLEKGDSQ
jgi:hypothetical protein